MNIVIYARYSSHSQTEQSIEGQLQACYEYARANGHIVIAEYIDRAQSGTTDSRAEFQRMIADSDKRTFEAVLVYQLDRFARNRYDSAINKARLKKNGIRVISARENISDDASGILIEGVLESMAEYYSAELSQKIRRGMNINAEKCLSNGSNPGLGYTVDTERRFQIDPEGATIVREIFEMYASGTTVTEINKYLNDKRVKTSKGGAFNKNSLHRMLRNKRYIGIYIYKDTETPGGTPRIIDDELFDRVQRILDRNKAAPARTRGKEEYLLTTKLFCGYCREMMTGYGGTGKSGKAYHYYACKNAKKKLCRKKVVDKQYIEDRVVLECRKLLTDSNIERVAASVAAVCEADYDGAAIKRLKVAMQEADGAIENLWKALELGQSAEMITERIEKRKKEKEELEAQIAIETGKQIVLTAPQIRAFLYSLQKGNVNDTNNRRGIINIFLQAVYLWDDKLTIVLNGGDKAITMDDILLDEIEADNTQYEGSRMVAEAPPKKIPSIDRKALSIDGLLLPKYFYIMKQLSRLNRLLSKFIQGFFYCFSDVTSFILHHHFKRFN
jgi:site-specific DNA recombinase